MRKNKKEYKEFKGKEEGISHHVDFPQMITYSKLNLMMNFFNFKYDKKIFIENGYCIHRLI